MTSLPFITDFSSAAIVTSPSSTGWGTLRFAGLLLGDRAGIEYGAARQHRPTTKGNPFARIPAGALVRLNPNFFNHGSGSATGNHRTTRNDFNALQPARLTPPGAMLRTIGAGADVFKRGTRNAECGA